MPSRNLLILGVLGAALALAGCREQSAEARLPAQVAPEPVAAPAAPPASAPAAEADVSPALTGTLEPHRRSTLMPRVGGPVAKVHVREGDVVRQGAVLVSIDPEQYRLHLRQAEAGLAGARVQLDATKLEWERLKGLLAEKAVPKSQFDLVDAKYKGALVAVQAAEVALDMARKANRDATIRAPYSGVIVRKHVSEGDNAAAMPPTPLITMEETGTLDLRVQVPAADIERVHQGDSITVHFPSTGKDVVAKITRVVPTLNPGTRTFSVIVELDNAAQELRAGMFAEVRLTPPATATARTGK